MKIVGVKRLKDFCRKNNQARKPLTAWAQKAELAVWLSFDDIRNTFNSADYFRGMVIFNVGGNKHRLIASIEYKLRIVYIRQIMTHSEYETNKWKKKYEYRNN